MCGEGRDGQSAVVFWGGKNHLIAGEVRETALMGHPGWSSRARHIVQITDNVRPACT